MIWRHDALVAALASKARHGGPGRAEGSSLAAGEGWRAYDVVCTLGPCDRPFEERHDWASVSLVLSGAFACRSRCGTCLLSPGAWFLVSGGEPIVCSHQHGEGDRCLSFQFDPEVFARLAHGAAGARVPLARQAVPPLRAHAALAARAMLAVARGEAIEEVAFEVAGTIVQAAVGGSPAGQPSRHHAAIVRSISWLGTALDSSHPLVDLARAANMSPYHFLRTFKAVTGITPHQWLLRARLREAAQRLASSRTAVTAIALDVGFDDLSNFIRSFRAEFGVSPRQYRLAAA